MGDCLICKPLCTLYTERAGAYDVPQKGEVCKSYCESSNYRESRIFHNAILYFKVQPRLLKLFE